LLLKDTKTNNDTQLLPAQYKYEERKKTTQKQTHTHTHTHKERKKTNKQTNKRKKERKTNTLMWCWWASSVNEAPVISLPVV
jgi:ABC-type Zn2+ transport system substrate-binding protein/surface adhesin